MFLTVLSSNDIALMNGLLGLVGFALSAHAIRESQVYRVCMRSDYNGVAIIGALLRPSSPPNKVGYVLTHRFAAGLVTEIQNVEPSIPMYQGRYTTTRPNRLPSDTT